MIDHDLPNCKWLQQNVNVISSREKKIGSKVQFYHPKMVGA